VVNQVRIETGRVRGAVLGCDKRHDDSYDDKTYRTGEQA
jgi:hypothetical protein